MTQGIVVAVDGPAAAGKTTTSKELAASFNLSYLESGRAYRTLAHHALLRRISPDNRRSMISLTNELLQKNQSKELFDPHFISDSELRSREISIAVSAVSKIAEVRSAVTAIMHSWAAGNSASIIEGRDIGTAVFPSAQVKFFLTASPASRAARRHHQEAGSVYEDVLADVLRRDQEDTTRKASPLKPAMDSVVIDTTDLALAEVIGKMSEVCLNAGLTRKTSHRLAGTSDSSP